MSIKKDKYYINLANNIAKNNLGYSGPNPSVGAVVVKKNNILSFGSTNFSGRPHAEVSALNKLTFKDKKNSTIYISLEPCSHYGKTPPCVNKLIYSKVKKVVYSAEDVDQRTAGKAYKILKSHKIKVSRNILNSISKKIYKNYFYSKKNQKPIVYGKLAISKDFYTKNLNNKYITNDLSLRTTHILRSKVNCILSSSKTINEDNPKLDCRIDGLKKSSPQVAVLDKNLKININSFIVKNAKFNRTYLFYNKIDKNKFKLLKSKKLILIYAPLHNNNLNFSFILKKLYNYEISSLLVEGGKTLTLSLLKDNLFKEFYLFISPKLLNKTGIIKVNGIKSKLSKKFKKIKYNEIFLDKDDLIHYY